jgi:hypothetical protein
MSRSLVRRATQEDWIRIAPDRPRVAAPLARKKGKALSRAKSSLGVCSFPVVGRSRIGSHVCRGNCCHRGGMRDGSRLTKSKVTSPLGPVVTFRESRIGWSAYRFFVAAGACVRSTSPDYKAVLLSGFSRILDMGPPAVFIAHYDLSVLRPNSFLPHWPGRPGLKGGGM